MKDKVYTQSELSPGIICKPHTFVFTYIKQYYIVRIIYLKRREEAAAQVRKYTIENNIAIATSQSRVFIHTSSAVLYFYVCT